MIKTGWNNLENLVNSSLYHEGSLIWAIFPCTYFKCKYIMYVHRSSKSSIRYFKQNQRGRCISWKIRTYWGTTLLGKSERIPLIMSMRKAGLAMHRVVQCAKVEQNTGNSFPSHDLSCSCESIEDHETLSKPSVEAAVSRPLSPMRRAVRIRCIAALRGAKIDYF